MRHFLPGRSALPLVLVATVAWAREPATTLEHRTLIVSEDPGLATATIKEEVSDDHALATLLAKGQVKKTPFRSEQVAILKDG